MYRYVSSHGNPLDISQNDTFVFHQKLAQSNGFSMAPLPSMWQVSGTWRWRNKFNWLVDLFTVVAGLHLLRPGKLTWNPKLRFWKMIFLFNWVF